MGLERGMQAVVTTVVFNVLAFVFILVRCVSRFIIIKQAGTEDYLILSAFVLSIGLTATIVLREYSCYNPGHAATDCCTAEKDHGLGQHADTVSEEDNETLSQVISHPEWKAHG
jgi:hypothetical protein